MAKQAYECAKCRETSYRAGELRTTGSGISRFLNLQNHILLKAIVKTIIDVLLFQRDSLNIFGVIGWITNQHYLVYAIVICGLACIKRLIGVQGIQNLVYLNGGHGILYHINAVSQAFKIGNMGI